MDSEFSVFTVICLTGYGGRCRQRLGIHGGECPVSTEKPDPQFFRTDGHDRTSAVIRNRDLAFCVREPVDLTGRIQSDFILNDHARLVLDHFQTAHNTLRAARLIRIGQIGDSEGFVSSAEPADQAFRAFLLVKLCRGIDHKRVMTFRPDPVGILTVREFIILIAEIRKESCAV